ncbi:HlyD family efflux transporter periplasmic adaptor subunit [candidate division GN15 bacterium]|nr:HlyD family efflux transporter periplasmic adaptor subunit [candidate division GN15 bacterium]
MRRLISQLYAVTLVLALLFLIGCSGDNGFRGGSGLIEADESMVSAEMSGRVVDLRFAEGDDVTAGDTLLVIDPTRVELLLSAARAGREVIEANLKTARIQVDQAERSEDYAEVEFKRLDKLVSSGTANKQQLDKVTYERDQAQIALKTARANVQTLEAQLEQADAEIAQLARQLEDCYPISPVSGVVTDKLIDNGELLAPGKAMAMVSQLDTVWVKVYLPAGDFAQVRIGDEANVSTESGGQEFTGRVVWTSEEAEFTPKNVQTEESRADLVYAVKVRIPNNDRYLKIGMPVFVILNGSNGIESE